MQNHIVAVSFIDKHFSCLGGGCRAIQFCRLQKSPPKANLTHPDFSRAYYPLCGRFAPYCTFTVARRIIVRHHLIGGTVLRFDWESRLRRYCLLGNALATHERILPIGQDRLLTGAGRSPHAGQGAIRAQPLSASDDRRERGEGRRRWDPRSQTMKLMFKHPIAATFLVLSFAAPVAAGPLEDANAAIKRRDYATALRLIRPLAEQGNANAQYNLGVFYEMA
jgi:hypothetical protein